MAYLMERDVLKGVKTREIVMRNNAYTMYEAYLGIDPLNKKPVRFASNKMEVLKKKISDFYKKISVKGPIAVQLKPFEVMDAREALEILAKAGISTTLTNCAMKFIEMQGPKTEKCTVTLERAYQLYAEAKSNTSASTQKNIRDRVGSFVQCFGATRKLSEITAKEVSSLLKSRFPPSNPKSITSYNGHLGDIKTFVKWCAHPEQAFISETPLAVMQKIAREYVQPKYTHAEEVEKLFRYLEDHRDEMPTDLAHAILSFFCGMRQVEIARISEGPESVVINLEERFIRIIKVKGSTRGFKPRTFTIPDLAIQWMKSFDFMSAVVKPNSKFRYHLVDAARRAGADITSNAGRHTFITFYSAVFKNQVDLTKIVGNSEDVRDGAYDGLATEAEGRRFFAITPRCQGS